MGRTGLAGVLVSALLLLASGCGSGGPSAGGKLPALTVRVLEPAGGPASAVAGAETTLADLAGRPMVLNVWAPWCPPCRTEMPDFDVVAAEHPEIDFIGLATGTEELAAAEFAAKVGVSYGLYYDVDDVALDELGITDLPATLFIDADGTIVATHHGALTAHALTTQLSDSLSR